MTHRGPDYERRLCSERVTIEPKPYSTLREKVLARMRVAGFEDDQKKRDSMFADILGDGSPVTRHELETAWAIGQERAIHERMRKLEAKDRVIT